MEAYFSELCAGTVCVVVAGRSRSGRVASSSWQQSLGRQCSGAGLPRNIGFAAGRSQVAV